LFVDRLSRRVDVVRVRVGSGQATGSHTVTGTVTGSRGESTDRSVRALERIDENNYCVHFSGKFWGLFPFEYDVMLTVVERKEDSVTMSGSKNLGLLFGTFSYNATVTETTFNASYCSRKDHGVFHMTRVCRP
jgi:hypothetical protein